MKFNLETIKKKIRKILIFSICLLVLAGFLLWQGIYLPKGSENRDQFFLVKKGSNLFEISRNLRMDGLIKSNFYFNFYVLARGKTRNLQSGEYLLSPSMSVKEIAQNIIEGQASIERTITIVEGWNIRDIAWYFENEGMFQAEELMEVAGFPTINYSSLDSDLPRPKDFSDKFELLKEKPKSVGLEGYLFPDTYRIYRRDGIEDILEKVLENFESKIDVDIREEIKKQGKSVFEIITMASLIEKEVRTFDDKKRVSGILWKRMDNNIPLQVDATISYITGKKTTKISKEETEIDSFYNTYKYKGLPLGPICNPGIESIKAALYPEENGFWYYLSNSDGETFFSKTLEEHNVNKSRHLQ